MQLLVIAPSLRNTSPGSRFRIEQWMPYLEAQGVRCTYAAFEDDELHQLIYTTGNYTAKAMSMFRALRRRFSLLEDLDRFDAVFIYEEAARVGPAILERLIRRRGVPIIYDFCDPIFLPYSSPRNRRFSHLKCFGKTATICRIADHVIVGNEELASYARHHNPRVSIVPITIDTAAYQPKTVTRGANEPPVIGWTGSHSTVPHLDGIRDVLEQLAGLRRFRLEVVGTTSYHVAGVETTARPWSAANEVSDLNGFDIGIMPLPEDPWTKLRSHLKIRQYMGVGLAAVASPVGVNVEVVRNGVNGFLAGTRDAWISALTQLIDDPTLRMRMGREARATIERSYSGKVWAQRVLDIVRRVADGRAMRTL
jgi:glycosyltransferase involved in cell wall biosynthesis